MENFCQQDICNEKDKEIMIESSIKFKIRCLTVLISSGILVGALTEADKKYNGHIEVAIMKELYQQLHFIDYGNDGILISREYDESIDYTQTTFHERAELFKWPYAANCANDFESINEDDHYVINIFATYDNNDTMKQRVQLFVNKCPDINKLFEFYKLASKMKEELSRNNMTSKIFKNIYIQCEHMKVKKLKDTFFL